MKNSNKIISFGLLTILCSCLPGIGEWDITLYEQKIEGTSKALYKYDAWGGRDSHTSGYAILDTTKTFKIQGVKNVYLDYLIETPTKNLIEVVEIDDVPYKEMEKMKLVFTPIQVEEKVIDGIKIKTKHYQEKGYRQINNKLFRYEFSDFKETKDSICFYDLNDIKSMVKAPHRDSIKVKKGHIIIRQNANKEVIAIEIKNLMFSKTGNDSLISKTRYDLTPKHIIKSTKFSDYGIFKEKSTVPNKG